MPSLLESLSDALGGDNVAKIGQHLGTDEQTTKMAIGAALPLLVGGIARSGSDEKGAEELRSIVSRGSADHVSGEVDALLRDGMYQQSPQTEELLKHTLGDKQDRVEQGVSKSSGLDPQMVSKLLKILAPIVIGVIMKHNQASAGEADSMPDVLRREREEVEKHDGGLLGKIFDQDGDGDFDLSDIAKLTMQQVFGKS